MGRIRAALMGMGICAGVLHAAEVRVVINPAQRYQTLEGWGSSLCWWAGQIGSWDEKKVADIVQQITSPDGLNMNIFRYNIGGGDDPAHRGGHMVKGKGVRAEMEGFQSGPGAAYDWTADAAQRRILLALARARKDVILEAFANSPPYWMTYSGCSAGHVDPKQDNLKPEYYGAFCRYLLDVCAWYQSAHAITFRTLEPFNEPLTDYWPAQGSQEGCHFSTETQITLLRILDQELKKRPALKLGLAASDETSTRHCLQALKAYQQAGDILPRVRQINTHTYFAKPSERAEIQMRCQQAKKPLWQSETGPMGMPKADSALHSNLLLTQKLFDDLRVMQPVAWLDWQLFEEGNETWCLWKCNFKKQSYHPVKNFYVRMQITRFFKQGYTLIESSDPTVLAAISPSQHTLVLAVLNTEKTEKAYAMQLPQQVKSTVVAYRTSATEDCAPLTGLTCAKTMLNYSAPARSLTTVVLTVP